jgi:hypothetical protein
MMNYQRAAVASTFSPTFAAVLAEARNFAAYCEVPLEIVHAAIYDAEKEKRFRAALPDAEIRWAEGETPVRAILGAVERYGYELLIAGALQSENDERLFTSGVTRGLLRDARCDLLLVPRPMEEPQPLRRLVFAFDPGEDCAVFLERVAGVLEPEHITIAVMLNPFAAAIAASRGDAPHDVDEWLEKVTEGFCDSPIDIEPHVVNSNTGYNLHDVVQGLEADLLVVKARPDAENGLLPMHMDWLYQVIPTRLLVVR